MNVKPEDLPSLPIKWKSALPKCSGIYFAIDAEGKVQYIGRSKNINQRWASSGHHRYERLVLVAGIRIAWMEICESSLLPEIESALIEWFCPPLNRLVVNHKKGKTRIEEVREKAGKTQREVANALGVTDQTVSNWENGVRQMKLTIRQTISLCQVLNCSLEDLLEEELKNECH